MLTSEVFGKYIVGKCRREDFSMLVVIIMHLTGIPVGKGKLEFSARQQALYPTVFKNEFNIQKD